MSAVAVQNDFTNDEFLTAVFGPLAPAEAIWTTRFQRFPRNGESRPWAGKPGNHQSAEGTERENAYFAVSTILPGADGDYQRLRVRFGRMVCVVLDDAPPDTEASWVLQTSPGKHQVGFILSPEITDEKVATRLQGELSRQGLVSADTNGYNAVRYVRLPVGCNTKYEKPTPCVVLGWNPERTYSLEDIAGRYGLNLDLILNGSGSKDSEQTQTARQSDKALIQAVVTGESYHDPLLKLSARYRYRGMDERSVIDTLEGLMQAVPEKDERWRSRVAEIPRAVRGAFERFEAREDAESDSADGEPRYHLMTGDELAGKPPVQWRVKGVLPEQGLAAVYGPSASGKSFLVLDMLGAIAEGREWFGYRTKPCPVVYLALEGEAGIAQRMAAYKAARGSIPKGMRFVSAPFSLLAGGDVSQLAEAIKSAGFENGIVAIDTLNRAAPGADENSPSDMGAIIKGTAALRSLLGGLGLLVHHTGKDTSKGLRGHTSLFAALDGAIEVRRDGNGDRSWSAAKVKDGRDGEGHGFRLEIVDLGTDEDGDPITSAVIAPVAVTNQVTRRPTPRGANQTTAWNVLGPAFRASGESRPEGVPDSLPYGRPVLSFDAATATVSPHLLQVEARRRTPRAREAIQGLVNVGLLVHDSGWVWCA